MPTCDDCPTVRWCGLLRRTTLPVAEVSQARGNKLYPRHELQLIPGWPASPYAWTLNFEMCFKMQELSSEGNSNDISAGDSGGISADDSKGISAGNSKFERLKKSLSKSGRLRSSASTFWSWSTGFRFGLV